MSGSPLPAVLERRTPAIKAYEGAALIAGCMILVLFRLHAFDLPLETDECNYAVIAARLLAGDRLYVDVWDHQPFGVFSLFAGTIALFGDAPCVFRWLALAFSAGSLLLVYAILRRAAGRNAAVVGAVLFAVASSDPGTGGEGCNREIYMNTLVLAGWYFAMRSAASPGPWLFASGSALAIGSSIKTVLAVHWAFLAAWIVASAWRPLSGSREGTAIVRRLGWFALGPAMLWSGAYAYFGATGRLREFVDAVVLFNIGYSEGAEPFLTRFVRFFAPPRHPFIFNSAMPLWIGAVMGSIWLIGEYVVRRNLHLLAILLLLLAGYVATCLPGRFWPHYYYLMLPALVLTVATTIERCTTWLRGRSSMGGMNGGLARTLLYLAAPIALTITEGRDYLLQPPFGITVKRYNSRDFWGRAQGQNVASVTEPEDTIFVFGNDASIYYYSRRRCASRYTMITGLSSGMRGAEERRQILLKELRNAPPRIIVVLFDEQPFDEWKAFLHEHYGEPVGWDMHDEKGEAIMFVLVRKGHPITARDWNWDRSSVGGWQLGARR